MNDKDKEVFDEWLSDASNHYADALAYEFERHLCFVSWQAACEYKEMQQINGSKMKQMNDRIEDLLAENKKLREALEKIVDRYFDLPYEVRMKKGLKEGKESLIAREALKEGQEE